MDFKNLHIGSIIKQRISGSNIEITRICKFMKCTEDEIKKMYDSKSLDSEILLKWSKLTDFDFFRLYTQHLILYSPPIQTKHSKETESKHRVQRLRKNIYTIELIDFILQRINSGEMTKSDVINSYKIPRTTLYKWISKYNKEVEEESI